MKRILTRDIEELAHLRDRIRVLQEQEKAVREKITAALPLGESVERGHVRIEHRSCLNGPDYKAAYIAIAGEEAAAALPRTSYTKLVLSYV